LLIDPKTDSNVLIRFRKLCVDNNLVAAIAKKDLLGMSAASKLASILQLQEKELAFKDVNLILLRQAWENSFEGKYPDVHKQASAFKS
jgi:hypothetical protein